MLVGVPGSEETSYVKCPSALRRTSLPLKVTATEQQGNVRLSMASVKTFTAAANMES
jgi:hypothetical protein